MYDLFKKTMTPSDPFEREAERIWDTFWAEAVNGNTQKPCMTKLIAQALRAAVEKAVIEDRKLWDDQRDLDVKIARKEGFSAGIEASAKVARHHEKINEGRNIGSCVTASVIADAIEALQPSEKTGG